VTVAAVLVVAGVVGLSVFGWLVWPPLVVLPISVACLAAGLLIDWEAPRGKSAPSHHPPQ
jgi:hypothetical protein